MNADIFESDTGIETRHIYASLLREYGMLDSKAVATASLICDFRDHFCVHYSDIKQEYRKHYIEYGSIMISSLVQMENRIESTLP